MSSVPFEAHFDRATGMLTLVGDIDAEGLTDLHDALDRATDAGRRPASVDLAAVTYLPNAAIGVLGLAMRRGRVSGRAVDLHAPNGGCAALLLQRAGLDYRTP